MKKIKIRNIIILVVLLAFNAYAWFIYTTKVSMNLSAHVSAWDVEFASAEGGVTSNLDVVIDRVYPGMETYERVISVTNRGDVDADLTYEIRSVRLMDQNFVKGQIVNGTTLSSDDIEDMLANNYPFKVTIETDETNIQAENGTGSYTITVEWDFESGNDAADTFWGNKAAEYNSAHPDLGSIEIDLLLIATQSGQ